MPSLTAACSRTLARAVLSFHPQTTLMDTPIEQLRTQLETNSRLKYKFLYDVFQTSEQLSGDPDIGLLAYKEAHPEACNPFSPCLLSAPTLGVALSRMVSFHALVSTGTHINLERGHHNTVRIVGLELGIASAPRTFLDAGAALLLGLLHFLTPNHKPMPVKVEFTYPKPQSTEKLEQCFGRHLCFSAPANCMTFSDAILDLPIPTASPVLDGYLFDHATALAQELLGRSVAAKLRRVILENIAVAKPVAMAEMATALGISRRSLQSALSKERTSFTQVFDECRLRTTHDYLVGTDKSVKYIATALGFTDQSSFNKACP